MKLNEMHGWPNFYDGLFGIEVEVEGGNLPPKISKFWKTERDGSLRGEAYEYILKAPFDLEDAVKALQLLNNELADSRLDFSFRTSVHVHVNIQHLTKEQLNRFIYTSYLLEDLLVEFCGGDRVGNRFCLRSRDAEDVLIPVNKILQSEHIPQLHNDMYKYCAINLVPVYQRGSVEFRSMRGTLDMQTLCTWLKVLEDIYMFSINSAYPLSALETMAETRPDELLERVIAQANFFKFEGYEEVIKDAAQRMVMCIPRRKGKKVEEVVVDRMMGQRVAHARVQPAARANPVPINFDAIQLVAA